MYTGAMEPVLVTSYVDPDLDGVAGMFAYAEFLRAGGTDAVAGIIGKPQVEAAYVLGRFAIPCPDIIPDARAFDRVVLVDTSDLNDLEGTVPAGNVIEVIDHRTVSDPAAFPNARVQIEAVGAVDTLITERFMHGRMAISTEAATLLCGGIISNTYNFRGGATTERDRAAYAWCDRIAHLPDDFWHDLFMAKSDLSGSRLVQRIEDDFSWFLMGGLRIGIAELELIGARDLAHGRTGEIVAELMRIKDTQRMDLVFLNTVGLQEGRTFLVAPQPEMQWLLKDILHVTFADDVAEVSRLIMRKEIVPLLKRALG
jgi:manganese-dependent inorganic pyrophosphatase